MLEYKLMWAPIEKERFLNQMAVSSELEAAEWWLEKIRGKDGFRPWFPLLTPASPQQQTEVARRAQTQEEKLAAALRVEVHNTSCQIQSLQAETESLRALVSGPGRALAFPAWSFTLNCLTVVMWVSHLTAHEFWGLQRIDQKGIWVSMPPGRPFR